MSERIAKVNNLILQNVSQLLASEVDVPDGALVTVVRVEATRDLRHAKIWLSIFPTESEKDILKTFINKRSHIQHLLHQKLYLKPLPRISFLIDTTEQEAARIENLLDQIKKKS